MCASFVGATLAFTTLLAVASPSVAASPQRAAPRARSVAELFDAPPSLSPEFIGGTTPKQAVSRVVTLAPSITELLFALGEGARVVGVSRFDDHPPEVRRLPKIGGFLDPSLEAVVGLRPDLVIGVPNPSNRATLERLVRLGVPVLAVPGDGLQDIPVATRAIARALGGPVSPKAEAFLRRLEADLEAVRARVRDRAVPRVAFVYGAQPLILAGPGSFADALLALVGAENVVTSGGPYPQVSLEGLVDLAPEVIIDASGTHGTSEGPWRRFPNIPAVARGRVHAVEAEALLRPGPRIAAGAEELRRLVHP